MLKKMVKGLIFVVLIFLIFLTVINFITNKPQVVTRAIDNSDNIAPSVSITFPQNNYFSKTSYLTVKGVANDNVKLKEIRFKYNYGEWEMLTGNSWSKTIELSKGENFIYVQAFDKNGNASPISSIKVYS